MLEFEPNTLAFMTASLEQCCKKLKNDTPGARKFIADKLKECARRGRVGQIALAEAGEEAVAELNSREGQGTAGWRSLFRWAT
jgi:hypothetical protein